MQCETPSANLPLRNYSTQYQANYEDGKGVPRNYQEARRLYQLSAAQDPTMTSFAHGALKRLTEKVWTEFPLLGKRVVITGTSRGGLSSMTGVVVSFDARRRYVVILDRQPHTR